MANAQMAPLRGRVEQAGADADGEHRDDECSDGGVAGQQQGAQGEQDRGAGQIGDDHGAAVGPPVGRRAGRQAEQQPGQQHRGRHNREGERCAGQGRGQQRHGDGEGAVARDRDGLGSQQGSGTPEAGVPLGHLVGAHAHETLSGDGALDFAVLHAGGESVPLGLGE